MAMCEVCGKTKQYGHNVSHSKRRTKRVFRPNIFRKKMSISKGRTGANGGGEIRRISICAKCLKKAKRSGAVRGAEDAVLGNMIVQYVDWREQAAAKRKIAAADEKKATTETKKESAREEVQPKEEVSIEEIVGKRKS